MAGIDNIVPLSTNGGQQRILATQSGSRSLPAGYIHLGVAKEIAPTLRDLGIDPDPIIQDVGLDPHSFDDGSNVIPHTALGRLCTLSVARTNCTHFGLLVGQRATILSLGIIGRLMLHSATVGDALRSLVSHLSIQNRDAVPSLVVEADTALFSYSIYQPDVESADQISDGAIACALNALRALCGSEWSPIEVLLPRQTPTDQEPYRRHFRAPVRFNQEIAAIAFPARDLKLRIVGADPLLHAMLEERICQIKGEPRANFTDHVRRVLRTRLPRAPCSASGVAALLAMHRRTLTRHLSGEGTGFRALTNEVRFEVARQLLAGTRLSLGQIAAVLGYSEASAFTRAFRRWAGQTPTAWRAGGRDGDELTISMTQTADRSSPSIKRYAPVETK